MVTAVSASSGAGAYAGTPATSSRAFSADLAQTEVKLSDWTHCVSAKTPQGKEKIAEITAKVDAIKAKMKAAENAEPKSDETATPPPGVGPLGHTLNVFA